MKILVTGATGFLGAHLVPLLKADGHQIRIVGRSAPTARALKDCEFLQGDLRSPETAKAAVAGVEVIYHLAGLVSFDPKDGRKMYELHVDATRTLLSAAREAGVKRVVLASTSGAIAVSKEERIATEADDYPITVVGRWPYYLSKIYEEQLALEYCKKHGIPLVVLNPSLLMGPGDDRLSSTWTVLKFLNQEIPAMPNGGLSFVDARDAAQVFKRALTDGEVYGRHLIGVNMPFTEFFSRLERLTGVPKPKLRLPSKVNVFGASLLEKLAKARNQTPALLEADVDIGEHFFYLDASKAERLLGFKPRDVQETLFDTVQFIVGKMPPNTLPGTKGRLADLRKS